MKETAKMVAKWEMLGLIPALVVAVYYSFDRSYWELFYEVGAYDNGADAVDRFIKWAFDYLGESLPILAGFAVIIAVAAIVTAKSKASK